MPKFSHPYIWCSKINSIQCLKYVHFAHFSINPSEIRLLLPVATMLSTKFVDGIFLPWSTFCQVQQYGNFL